MADTKRWLTDGEWDDYLGLMGYACVHKALDTSGVDRLIKALTADRKRIEELELEVGDFDRTLEVQHSRCKKAEDLWRKAHNKPHTIPDLGDLIEWLLSQIAARDKTIERLRKELGFKYGKQCQCGHTVWVIPNECQGGSL